MCVYVCVVLGLDESCPYLFPILLSQPRASYRPKKPRGARSRGGDFYDDRRRGFNVRDIIIIFFFFFSPHPHGTTEKKSGRGETQGGRARLGEATTRKKQRFEAR